MKTILTVVGCRPNFIKEAVLSPVLRTKFNEVLIHTGQHKDFIMSQAFFKELGIPTPKKFLRGDGLAQTTKGILMEILQHKPQAVLVYGDTRSTYSGALAAQKAHVPLIHIEAGCRCGNLRVKEEQYRIRVDRRAKYLFAPTPFSLKQLPKSENNFFVGDVMFDLFLKVCDRIADRPTPEPYVFLTLHRGELLENYGKLETIIKNLGKRFPRIVWPVHPHTAKTLKEHKISIPKSFKVVDPMGYMDCLRWQKWASLVVTDSGGIQKEATWLGQICWTLRNETEWHETVTCGRNILLKPGDILTEPLDLQFKPFPFNLFGDGNACEKITEILWEKL